MIDGDGRRVALKNPAEAGFWKILYDYPAADRRLLVSTGENVACIVVGGSIVFKLNSRGQA